MKTKDLKITRAKRKNFKQIAKMYMEEFSKPLFNEPWTLKKSIKKIKLFSKYCDIWEIWYENYLVGFIIINPNQWCPGEVIFGEEMAIKKMYQRKGIGTRVLKIIFEYYKRKGFKEYMGLVNKKSKSWGLHKKIGTIKSKNDFIMKKKLK